MQVGAYFQCYKNPVATYVSLAQFRKAYPQSSIVLLSDGGYDFSKMAEHFGAHYIHSNERLGVAVGPTKHHKQNKCFYKYIDRLCKALQYIREDYFMWLEDDVHVIKPYSVNFQESGASLYGNFVNKIPKEKLNEIPFVPNTFSEDQFYTGHGGSIYCRRDLLEILGNNSQCAWLIERQPNYFDFWGALDNDIFFCILLLCNSKKIQYLPQHVEVHQAHLISDPHAIHGFKQLYGSEADENIRQLFAESDQSSISCEVCGN